MLIEKVKKLPPMERLLYFITEREKVRLKKEAGKPRPWTDDRILQSYRFCNVRRMDDAVSQWILKNWYEPNHGHPHMLFATAMARLFNQPHTLAHIGFPESFLPNTLIKSLKEFNEEQTVFNAAYIVSTNGRTMNKIEYVVNHILKPLYKHKLGPCKSMEHEWSRLMTYNGLASFMSGQIVADLRHAVDGEWSDRNVWAAMGPGSKRGMNRLHGLDKDTPMSEDKFQDRLMAFIETAREELPEKIHSRLEAIDFQNTLCEGDKYERTLWGEGKPKRKYEGTGEI